MNNQIKEADLFLSSITKKSKKSKPNNLEMFYYTLAKEFSINLADSFNLPIPYLMNLLRSHNYIRTEEEKESKRNS